MLRLSQLLVNPVSRSPVVFATQPLNCLILYSYELDQRLRKSGRNVTSIAYDPGYTPETGPGRGAPAFMQWLSKTSAFKLMFKLFGGDRRLAFFGCRLRKGAVDVEYNSAGGKYIQSSSHTLREAKSSLASYDKRSAANLWLQSEQLIGLRHEEKPVSLT